MSPDNQQTQILQLQEQIQNLTKENESLKIQLFRLDYVYSFFNNYAITSETDIHGDIIYVSEPFMDISGYTQRELIGQNHRIVRHPDMEEKVFKEMWETITSKQVWRGEVKNLKKDGGYYWVDSIIFPILNKYDEIEGYKSIRFDITDKIKAKEAFTDILGEEDSLIL
ncbi:PAS domain-containing protein [Halarcobacter sp.]|uniref:PAS domain-containing protein n=1 Tax=Halarcobacter sp. TaxID=2321133 RepID=UPI003A90A1F2